MSGAGPKPLIGALIAETRLAAESLAISPLTVFMGGGTPSALSPSLIEHWRQHWDFESIDEFTMEANPATITADKAKIMRRWGVNRISLGVQSFAPSELDLLGRVHSPEDVRETFAILRREGFTNISIDLMFALPGQSLASWQHSLRAAISLAPEHISTYNLNYEEDTAFLEKHVAGEYATDPSLERDMYLWAIGELSAAGFHQVEISNHSREGYACKHNLACWDGADYLGIGPSACSTIGGLRWKNIPDSNRYISRLESSPRPLDSIRTEVETIDPTTRRREKILLGIRTSRGVYLGDLTAHPDIPQQLVREGLAAIESDRLKLTPHGMLVADDITGLLYE